MEKFAVALFGAAMALASAAWAAVAPEQKALGVPDRKEFDDGETECEFYSSDFARKLEIEVRGGVIGIISCSLRD